MGNLPKTVVGVPSDRQGGSFRHDRTLGPGREQYAHVWSGGVEYVVVADDAEAVKEAKQRGVNAPKLKQKPGKERYAKNQHEPIRI